MLDFLTRSKLPEPTLPDALMRIDALKLELSRATRRIDALEARLDGKPMRLEDADSARKIMAYIGRKVGHSGAADTAHLGVRTALLKHASFAQLRDALARKGEPSIVENEPRLRWLAERSRMVDETRYALILRGDFTVAQLAQAER